MKKTILVLLILLAFAPHSHAASVTSAVKAVVAAGGGAAGGEYLTCTGSSASTETLTAGYPILSKITPVFGGSRTLTSLGISLSNVGSATECWVGLYTSPDDINFTRVAYATISSLTTGWNVGPISYAITTGVTYSIIGACNNSATGNIYTDGDDSYYFTQSYVSTPSATYANPSAWSQCKLLKAGY